MRPAIIAALAAVLAGCTPMQWVKRGGATPEQFDQDRAQCRQQAWGEAQWRMWLARPLGPIPARDRFGRAFPFWPSYGPYADPFFDPYMEELRLTNFCLQAKGYELVPADTIQPSPAGSSSGKP